MDIGIIIFNIVCFSVIFIGTYVGISCVTDVLSYCCRNGAVDNRRQQQEVRAETGKRAISYFFQLSLYIGFFTIIRNILARKRLHLTTEDETLKGLDTFEKIISFLFITIIFYNFLSFLSNVLLYCQNLLVFRHDNNDEEQQQQRKRQVGTSVIRCLLLISVYSLMVVLLTNQTLVTYNINDDGNQFQDISKKPPPLHQPQTPPVTVVKQQEAPPVKVVVPEVLVQNNNGPFLEAVKGGVLPVRRFIIDGGSELENKELESNLFTDCNEHCSSNTQCFAWEFNSESKSCRLFTEGKYDDVLSAKQATGNDPNFVVGFTQTNTNVLSLSTSNNNTKSNKILYILNVPKEEIPSNLNQIVNDILPKSWMPNLMDLVIATSRDYPIEVNGGNTRVATLRNPFRSKPTSSDRGSNSHMTLPIARARFPGYKGYLQVHYETMLRLWEIPTDTWFDNRPWVIFQPLHPKEQTQQPRRVQKQYPYGTYSYSWYNFDSGFTGGRSEPITRSNFDAALHAMKDLCSDNEKTRINITTSSPLQKFCPNVSINILSPFFPQSSPTNAFYVPNNDLGTVMTKALTLFGEHDVFSEISLPTVQSAILPDNTILEMPFCDGSQRTLGKEWSDTQLKFKKYFSVISVPDGNNLDCPVVSPVNFEKDLAVQYWKKQIEEKCESCKWDLEKDVQWNVVKE